MHKLSQTQRILGLCLLIFALAACKKDGNNNPANTNAACTAVSEVDMSNPDRTVGDGSAGSCTEQALRDALVLGGNIKCDCGNSEVVISISSELVVSSNTVLDGGGVVVLDGGNQSRILLKESGADLTLQNLTFRKGKAPSQSGFAFDECGGAILARGNDTGQAVGGNFTAINVVFENNQTGSQDENDVAGGAVYLFNVPEATFSGCTFTGNSSSNGGAIGNLGSDLIIINSTFSGNQAVGSSGFLTGHGGCINIDGVGLSGVNKVFTVCGCTFTNNSATKQGGVSNSVISDGIGAKVSFDKSSFESNTVGDSEDGNGGAIFHMEDDHTGASNEDNFSLSNSTFVGNQAGRNGGALWIIIDGRGTLTNCTFDGNKVLKPAGCLGGAIAFSAAGYGGDYEATNLTFANNTSEHFAGAVFVSSDNEVNFVNTIFSNNTSSFEWEGHQLAGPGTYTGSNNLQFPETRWNGTNDNEVPGRISVEDPLLGTLSDNGGPTQTISLGEGSPAINTGTASGAPSTDQRGETRDANPDLGAYEKL